MIPNTHGTAMDRVTNEPVSVSTSRGQTVNATDWAISRATMKFPLMWNGQDRQWGGRYGLKSKYWMVCYGVAYAPLQCS